jgi:hypothetical protein
MTIRDLNWKLETTFTRKQVIAMSKVAEFVGNIQKDLSDGFPSAFKDFDWAPVREVMALFSTLGLQDTIGYRSLCKAVQDVNSGRVHFMCGKVVPVSPFEVGEKVKCVEHHGTMLNYGSVYVVDDFCTDGIRLEGVPGVWFEYNRFVKLIEPGKGGE